MESIAFGGLRKLVDFSGAVVETENTATRDFQAVLISTIVFCVNNIA